jgi:hypothetical protein
VVQARGAAVRPGERDLRVEADASPVVQRLAALQRVASGSRLAQRKEEWKPDNHRDKALNAFVTTLDRLVETAARVALSPDDLDEGGGYLGLWKATAEILRGGDQDLGELTEDERAELAVARRFAAARFGYAVETLACADIGALNGALPQGLQCALQAGRGMTRPDLIVVDGDGRDVGWFDITSANSIGHIDRKTGGGWRTKPYVAEITYEPLDIGAIGTSEMTVGERTKRRNAARRLAARWQEHVGRVRGIVEGHYSQMAPQTKSKKEAAIRDAVSVALGFYDRLPPMAVKSVLRAIGLLPKDFGMSAAGGSKADGETILRDLLG